MACTNVNKNCYPNGNNNAENFTDLSYNLEIEHRKNKCCCNNGMNILNTNNNTVPGGIKLINCFNEQDKDLCCDPNGCCYECNSDLRNKFWPEFCHPRWLCCRQLYSKNCV